MAAPTALPMLTAPAAARPALPGRRADSVGGFAVRTTRARRVSVISVARPRSSRYMSSIWPAKPASSTATSSSQLPIHDWRLRFVEPTRAHRPSATAVLAWSIVPFHS